MISYRQYETYEKTQSEKNNEVTDDFRASTYQRYQGEKLANRFNTFTYWLLSKLMDSHNVGRKRESIVSALSKIKAKTLVIGIDSDILFPLHEQKFLSENIRGAKLEVIQSIYGHDGFLVEFEHIKKIIKNFYKTAYSEVLV